MGSLFGGRRKGKNTNVPRYATRQEVIDLFLKYYNQMPTEEGIIANMGNPGGPAAIEAMLKNSMPATEWPSEVPNIPDVPQTTGVMSKSYPYTARPRTMSYWRQINQHYLDDYLTFFICVDNNIMLIDVDKSSLEVRRERVFILNHEGEGCYFSAITPHHLFIPIENELRRYDIRNSNYEVMMTVDGQCWQPHSDYYEKRHSCSVKHGSEVVSWQVNESRYPVENDPDECQIDKSGSFLLIKERVQVSEDSWDEYNRVINLGFNKEILIQNEAGALGHSDCGFGFAYGENDFSNFGGALDILDLNSGAKKNLYHTDVWNMGYFSYSNAKPTRETFGVLSSSDGKLIKVGMDGSSQLIRMVDTHPIEYDRRVRANVCPEGQFCAYIDANFKPWIVRIP